MDPYGSLLAEPKELNESTTTFYEVRFCLLVCGIRHIDLVELLERFCLTDTT